MAASLPAPERTLIASALRLSLSRTGAVFHEVWYAQSVVVIWSRSRRSVRGGQDEGAVAENHGFVWVSVMDHLIQIGAPDEPFMEGWTV